MSKIARYNKIGKVKTSLIIAGVLILFVSFSILISHQLFGLAPAEVVKTIRAGQTISTIQGEANAVTVVLASAYPNNNLKVGQTIVISGTTNYNGSFTIASVASQTEFTYTQADANTTQENTGNAGGDYSLLSLWQAQQKDLTAGDGEIAIAECYDDWAGGLTDNVTISGWTTDEANYIKITNADDAALTLSGDITVTDEYVVLACDAAVTNVVVNTNAALKVLGNKTLTAANNINIGTSGSSADTAQIVCAGDTSANPPYGTGATITAANINIYGSAGAGGSVTATGEGFAHDAGTGAGGTGTSGYGAGAGYGGAGGNSSDGGVGGSAYGSATNPIDLGSGGGASGGGSGGGAIALDVSTALTIDGFLASDGNGGTSNGGGGSGGSIKVTCDILTGAGAIRANGGNGDSTIGGGGGGGRVGIWSSSSSYTGSMTASGGSGYLNGQAGTASIFPTAAFNITATFDGVAPNAPTITAFTATGGTAETDIINTSNTGFEVAFTSPASEYEGTAHLYSNGSLLDTDITIAVSAGGTQYTLTGNSQSITDLGADGTKSLTVKIIDAAGNVGAASNTKTITKYSLSPLVSNVTSSTVNGTYIAGEVIIITIQFNQVVTVVTTVGTPTLVLNSGAQVDYSTGTGTDTLTFTYTILAGENSADLDYSAATSLALNGGTIKDKYSNKDADLMLAAPGAAGSLGANKDLVVDTAGPVISSGTMGTDGDYIDIAFDEGVYNTASGSGALEITDFSLTFTQNTADGGTATNVTVSSLTKTTGLALAGGETTIRAMLNITGPHSGKETIEITPVSASSIYDVWSNASSTAATTGALYLYDLGYGAFNITATFDDVVPTVGSVTVTPDPTKVQAISGLGIKVIFNEAVGMDSSIEPTVTYDPSGDTTAQACTGGTWSTTTNPNDTYTVYNDNAIDAATGDGTATISISGAKDSAGNTMTADTAHSFVIDTTASTISSVTLTPSTGTLKVGDTVDITVTAGGSEAGLTPSNATFNSQSVSLTDLANGTYQGTYTVVEGHSDATNPEATSITLTDSAGNTSAAASSSGNTLIIDANSPVVTDAHISITSTPTGEGSTYIVGDTVTAQWDNSATGDNNADTISSATCDFSSLGGGSAVAMTESSGIYTASYTITTSSTSGTGLTVSVKATDDAGNFTTTADTTSIHIGAGTLTLISPAPSTAHSFKVGATQSIEWTGAGDISSVIIKYSTDSGVTYDNTITTADSAAGSNSYSWTVPYDLSTTIRIKIQDASHSAVYDTSDTDFSVVIPTVTITAPNGAESWYAKESRNITWTSEGSVKDNSIALKYSTDSGSTYPNSIAAGEANDSTYAWTVPFDITAAAKVKISGYFYQGFEDTNDTQFGLGTLSSTAVSGTGDDAGVKLDGGIEAGSVVVIDDDLIAIAQGDGTCLIWPKCDGADCAGTANGGTKNWDDAMSWANGLEYKDYTDWYLPTKDELSQLYTYAVEQADPDYISCLPGFYWSSTEHGATIAYSVYFGNGGVNYYNKANAKAVRAVRAGQSSNFDFSVIYATPGTFTSQIFDSGTKIGFGTMTWTEDVPTNTTLTLKVRTDSNADMSTAADWADCPAVTSGDDISSLASVTDTHRYIQYYAEFTSTDTSATPTLNDVTINYDISEISDESNADFNILNPITVTDVNITVTTGTGPYKIADTVTVTWDNGAETGTDNTDVTGTTCNFSELEGGSAVTMYDDGTNGDTIASDNIWTAQYIMEAGTIDTATANVSVTATDGYSTTTGEDTTNLTVDNVVPVVTDAHISITSTPSGNAGVTYLLGDAVTVQWDNSAAGDNNSDTISGATCDFSSLGGGSAVVMTLSAGIYTASYTITTSSTSGTGLTASVKATDDAGNSTTTDTAALQVAGQMATASVDPASLVAGVTGNVDVSFTTINAIPSDGKIEVTFPSGFTLDSESSTTASSDTINGDLSAATDTINNIVTVTRSGGTEEIAGDEVITLSYVRNPTATGTSGSYALETQNSNSETIDKISSISGSLIVSDVSSYYTITEPADITAGGARAAYTVTRYDQYDNLSSQGEETAYLYTTSIGGNAAFYNAAADGDEVSSITFSDASSSANFWYYDELMGTFTITVSDNSSAADGDTGINDITDGINVKHTSHDHLRFSEDIGSPQKVGVAFNLPAIEAVDEYGNILTDDYSAAPYQGTKTVSYALSGEIDAPDENAADSWITTIAFSNGTSTTTLDTTLYRAQDTTITAAASDLAGVDIVSNTITVDPETAVKLVFSQQPSSNCIINVALSQQPKASVRDTYGNQTHDTYAITLYDSAATGNYSSDYSDAAGKLIADSKTAAAVDGEAAFSGVTYDTPGVIYIYAEAAEVLPNFSDAITFTVAGTSTVEAADTPVSNFNLTPANDTAANKFAVLKFKVNDAGADLTAALIDKIDVAVSGSGGNASSDIAWAGLYVEESGQEVQVDTATGDAITNSLITFGTAPDDQSDADLYSVPDNTAREFTVYIYMKDGKLSAVEGDTYTFDINEINIGVDTDVSTQMTSDNGAITLVTGTIVIDTTHLEIVNAAAGEASLSVDAGVGSELTVRAADANRNIDTGYSGNHTLTFSGLDSSPDGDLPLIEAIPFGYPITLNFSSGVSAEGVTTLTAYNAGTSDMSAAEGEEGYSVHTLQTTVNAQPADSISLVSGDDQSGAVNCELAGAFITIVKDEYGNPIPDINVDFNISSYPDSAAGQSISVGSDTTNVNGKASTVLTLGNTAGQYKVTAASGALTGSPVTFTAAALVPSGLIKVSGDSQSAQAANSLDNELVVKLKDDNGIGVYNANISFEIISYPDGASGQSLSVSSDITDSAGNASTALTLGDKSGEYTVRTSWTDGTTTFNVDFTAAAVSASPYKVILTGASSVTAGEVSAAFTITSQDQYSNNSNVGYGTAFSLVTASSGGSFYSDNQGQNAISEKVISEGSSSAAFYYKDSTTGNPTIAVTRTGGETFTVDSDSVSISVIPAGLSYFKVTASDMSAITAGDSKTIIVTAYDDYDNVKTDAGDINIVFSGANSSPSPSETSAVCEDIDFGSNTLLNFNDGAAAAIMKLYKAENVNIKASSGSIATSDNNDLDLTVKHSSSTHLKFAEDIATPAGGFQAGVEFALGTLYGVDLYDNLCDGANGAAEYIGSKTINYTLSGEDDAVDGSAADSYTYNVSFTSGASTTPLNTTLYRAQNTTVTAAASGLTGTNAASNSITVRAGSISKLSFYQQPATACFANAALSQQPVVAVADEYGNPVASANDQIVLTASTTTGSYTAVTNGNLSADSLQKEISQGVAAFSGVKYDYPESIYLRATAQNAAVDSVYSYKIIINTASDDGTMAAGVLSEPAAVSSAACSSGTKVEVFDFKITDAGQDGYGIKINQIDITRDIDVDTTGGWTDYISAGYITDGTTQILGSVKDNSLTFGDGQSMIYTVPDGGNDTFTLSIYFKNNLPAGADGKVVGFDADPNDDIGTETVGSGFDAAGSVISSSTVDVIVSKFIITGSADTAAAGAESSVYIKAADANGNIDTGYEGSKQIIFSGAGDSDNGDSPACNTVEFGNAAAVGFADGQNSTAITMVLYKAEGASIKAAASGPSIATSDSDDLDILVTGGQASSILWETQPKSKVVANAPWETFEVAVTDDYGNLASSSSTITVVSSGATRTAGCSYQTTPRSGVAAFNDFAVYSSSTYPAMVTISAAGTGLEGSGYSNMVTVSKEYSITVKAIDSIIGSSLTEGTLKILDADTGDVFDYSDLTNPVTGNSPYDFYLPYGKYNLNYNKGRYIEYTVEKSANVSADALDGKYDNNITWALYITSVAESMADYKVLGDFIYDENEDEINANVRLEKKGQQVILSEISKLQTCTLRIYKSSSVDAPIYIDSLVSADEKGNYWFTIKDAVDLEGFESGKGYFADMSILYGSGTAGDAADPLNVLYTASTTFDIGVAARLKTWIGEIKDEVSGVKTKVAAEAEATRSKITTEAEETKTKITTEAEKTKTEVTSGVTTIKSDISTAKTSIEEKVQSRILNQITYIREKDTVTIKYKFEPGLSPVIDVYDADNNLKITEGKMTETAAGESGIYEYPVKFEWGIGEYSVVCKEDSKGVMDGITIQVISTDLEQIASTAATTMGQVADIDTSNIQELSKNMDAVNNVVSTIVNSIDELTSLSGKLEEFTNTTVQSIYQQLSAAAEKMKEFSKTQGLKIEEMYKLSEDQSMNVEYLKNKTLEIKALIELQKEILEKKSDLPVTKTWLESEQGVLTDEGSNVPVTKTWLE